MSDFLPVPELSVRSDLENRDKRTNEMVHVINIDVIDNPEDATLGAFMLCELAQKVTRSPLFSSPRPLFAISDGSGGRFG